MFPYRAANFLVLRLARQPSALPTELKRNIYKSGNNLSFQQGNPQVFSAHLGLTSVFGMGTGISLNVIITRKLLTFFLVLLYYTIYFFILQVFFEIFLIFLDFEYA